MGLSKEGRMLRWAKTLYFLLTMLASLLLVCAPPLLVVILDLLLPSALLSAASNHSSYSTIRLSSHLKSYRFQSSLVDIPLVSVARSLLILCKSEFTKSGTSVSQTPPFRRHSEANILGLSLMINDCRCVFSV